MGKLILLRHGQSLWNKANLFTGWVDVPLSEQGIEEAFKAGELIRDIPIDVIYTSTLIRAQMTAMLAMSRHESKKTPIFLHDEGKSADWEKIYGEATSAQTIPVHQSWHLNERMYGELQGLNKAETAEKYGADQVHIWRRSYDVPPPNGESLEMTAARTIPYFLESILPELKAGKTILIAAHGNSLRSIIMELDHLSKEEVLSLEVATGHPILYDFTDGKFIKQEDLSSTL
ncbi:MAG: phosphoglycerate mutase [Waddliaceae bacterium]|nr:phosphoglycerate mutase [Waddliaceae bacterium]